MDLKSISLDQVFEDSLASVYAAVTALTTIHDNKEFLNPDSREHKAALEKYESASRRHFQIKNLISEAKVCRDEADARENGWKVVRTDNFNRELYSDSIHTQGISKRQAEELAEMLNRDSRQRDPDSFFVARPESEKDFVADPNA